MGAPFFRIEMLPARHGDCLWIEYGDADGAHRVLIDGGPVTTFATIEERLRLVPPGERAFDLIALSHVDADHVEGLVRLFAETPLPFVVREVWFNGWRQMRPAHGLLGAQQGEFLSALLARRAPQAWRADAPPWVVPDTGRLPIHELDGGMRLTLLSPTAATLDTMARAWQSALKKTGTAPGDLDAAWQALAKRKKFLPRKGLLGTAPDLDRLVRKQFLRDQAAPNGSSIAFLAEYGGKSALLLADAHPDVITASLDRLCAERQVDRLTVDAVKLSHHGSQHNTSEALLARLSTPAFLVSTNGEQFGHPDEACIARVLRFGHPQRVCFNYHSATTEPWLAQPAQEAHHYEAVVRAPEALALEVVL